MLLNIIFKLAVLMSSATNIRYLHLASQLTRMLIMDCFVMIWLKAENSFKKIFLIFSLFKRDLKIAQL